MSPKMFAKGNEYKATNTRTHETFTVTCVSYKNHTVTFVDAKGNTYATNHLVDSALTYNVRALIRSHHVYVDSKAA